MRGLRWLFLPQSIGETPLDFLVSEESRSEYHKVLTAAADPLEGTIDVSTFVGNNTDYGPDKIDRILDGDFHASGGADDADLDKKDGWLDLGPEDSSEEELFTN